MVDFSAMTQQDAKHYLRAFLAALPQRIEAFRAEVAAAGGPAPEELDLSVESLTPLWEWARPRFAWREGFVPAPLYEVPTRVDPSTVEPLDELPDWVGTFPSRWTAYATPTLWLVDGLGGYLGETVVRATDPPGRWAAGFARQKRYVYQNQPVVRIPHHVEEVQPFVAVGGLVQQVLMPLPGRDLRGVAEHWLGNGV